MTTATATQTCLDCTTVQAQFGPAAQCVECWERQESVKETPDTLFAFRTTTDGTVAVIGVKTA